MILYHSCSAGTVILLQRDTSLARLDAVSISGSRLKTTPAIRSSGSRQRFCAVDEDMCEGRRSKDAVTPPKAAGFSIHHEPTHVSNCNSHNTSSSAFYMRDAEPSSRNHYDVLGISIKVSDIQAEAPGPAEVGRNASHMSLHQHTDWPWYRIVKSFNTIPHIPAILFCLQATGGQVRSAFHKLALVSTITSCQVFLWGLAVRVKVVPAFGIM